MKDRSLPEKIDQDLDFKEWNFRSMADSVASVVEMAICMANGGGGTVVFGINDKAVGRQRAIIGVPPQVDTNRLRYRDILNAIGLLTGKRQKREFTVF